MSGTRLVSAAILDLSNSRDPNWKIAGSGDFNGDRNSDLLFQHNDGTLAVWSLDGIRQKTAILIDPSAPSDRF